MKIKDLKPSSVCTVTWSVSPGQTYRRLSLHVAETQPGHYCCGDGLCLSSNMVCDGNQDCTDRSDERHCTMVLVSSHFKHSSTYN